jgi:hypothetical protein
MLLLLYDYYFNVNIILRCLKVFNHSKSIIEFYFALYIIIELQPSNNKFL